MLAIPRCFGDTAPSGSSAAATSAARVVVDPLRDRDHRLEQALDLRAAQAGGHADDGGLGQYGDHRANPGGVRVPPGRDFHLEVAEELADARNYVVWRIEQINSLVEAGDPDACEEYVRLMGCLQYVVSAWRALHQV